MKKLFVCLALAGFALANPAFSQERAAAAPAAPAAGATHQVGLIDMAFVFKNYDKFKEMTEALQGDAKAAQAKAETMIGEMKTLQTNLQEVKEGTPEFSKIEKNLLDRQTELETFRKMQQREFLRKEAEIYKVVYLEVQDAVQKYAKFYKYTLIMRFNRQGVDDAENPQEIINSMNRQVVYYMEQDDLTDPILKFLNDEYAKSKGGAAAPAREARGGTTRPAATK